MSSFVKNLPVLQINDGVTTTVTVNGSRMLLQRIQQYRPIIIVI